MAAETRQAGLTADERSDIRSTVLDTRELIEDDLYRQLERYGVYEDERVDLEQLGHLDAYDRQTRRTIDAALDRELEATEGDYQRSVENYVREATKTYLNRLVALKAIEVRGLVTETLMERSKYGNRSEMLRTVDEVAGELTDQQDGGQGAALELAYTELTDEIGVIFEESEHTAIDLDFAVREDIIEQLNEIDESVWESDEAMGWVYQYFGEQEREEIDDRIDEENYKVQDTDVATKTQLFTPRYIVEWMVDNSLGRLWLEMHGEDTNIDDEDNCFYLAPLEESLIDRDAKNVRDIKILDPACGSGHMLFYAFDVLYEMYLEQGDVAEKYIPREILKHNLYGIDIDPGATQLAALSLYIKAKDEEPNVEIDQINIISADAVLVNGKKKKEVFDQTETELEERVLEQIWESFGYIREWGSLVRIEEKIEEIIDEEREKIDDLQTKGQARFTGDGEITTQSSFVSNEGELSWEQLKSQLLAKVSELAEEALEQRDPVEEMFTDEVEKSVELLDLFVRDYDIVISNPPYLNSSKMGENLKKYVKDNYIGSRDLYTAFIQRCGGFCRNDGYISMITMDTFMFLYSFRKLRQRLLKDMNFSEVAHLTNREEAYMNVCFTMRHSSREKLKPSRFNRLINYSDKEKLLKKVTEKHRKNNQHEKAYIVDQTSFEKIRRTPFVYWFGNEVLSLFNEYEQLGDTEAVKKGLVTGNNERFLRKYWEVPNKKIGDRYVQYQRSGTDSLYYDLPQDYIDWEDSGEKIKEDDGHSQFPNIKYRFREGLTFRGFGKYAVARIHSEDSLFDGNTHFVTTDRLPRNYLIGLGCSSLSRFIINGINPSPKCQAGDVKQLPVKNDLQRQDQIHSLVQFGIQAREYLSSLREDSYDFSPKNMRETYVDDITEGIYSEEMAEADVLTIHGLIDELIFEEYNISSKTQNRIYDEVPNNLAAYPHIENAGDLNISEKKFRKAISTKKIDPAEYDELIEKISNSSDKDVREICEELEISPYTVSLVRRNNDQYLRDQYETAVGRLVSFYIGCLVGRWDVENIRPKKDGILVFDDSFENNIESMLRRCLEVTSENAYEFQSDMEDLLGQNLDQWIASRFFRYHHCKEYRRRGQRIPIYWHLESDEGAFSCFLYYHAMNADTLPKLRGQYIDKKLDTLQNRLETIESELEATEDERARELRSEKEEIEADIDDITEFRDRVDALIDEGFKPDFEAGIWKNIQRVDEYNLLAVSIDKL